MAYIQIRISAEEKEEAQKVLEKMGLNFSSAIKLFFRRTVQEQKLPFEISVDKISPEKSAAAQSPATFKMQEWSGFSRRKIG
ncbi:type II toxin-antitoxin system RelB/DinJ family antitoxin [bacterium]|jgi:addiction module RelB/DinJ family antitoxin|nr:type II toxin-antitoxin system RelB/DinJ family antitoxin [bacterium]MBT6832183.1 type II toxin-antitoxin system RelB/DinJ family antitoxin [bacterium]MBT6996128.1 type II toxin-antitoxin system RelB/DinJ family antitoxin [bacterium]MBT7772208.1 type II toxin-antitoxin system RelB/DinJ family antitoxin [bacterium]